jgi:hypothetical protein
MNNMTRLALIMIIGTAMSSMRAARYYYRCESFTEGSFEAISDSQAEQQARTLCARKAGVGYLENKTTGRVIKNW